MKGAIYIHACKHIAAINFQDPQQDYVTKIIFLKEIKDGNINLIYFLNHCNYFINIF